MKEKIAVAMCAAVFAAAPLAAENVNGFENFTLSRNDSSASAQVAFADFSSRTRTFVEWVLARFSSFKRTGAVITVR